jgi:hypothetical protein
MKVNLKKIGAIVAGATILASSVSFAGLMFGSTQLVDDNGAPVAKVVIGEKAAASDGVAGGLIASKIVSEAYKMANLSASVSGTATCDADGAASGTCSVSDESVTLEVTVPGSVAAGTYTLNNLIGDYINRELEDRNQGLTAYSMGSDTSDTANPFTDSASGNLGPSDTEMFRIHGQMFSPFATATLTDDSSARTYSEQQDLWLKGDNHYSDTNDDVVGKLNFVSYTLKFKGTGDDLGIPVCTTPTNQDYTACKDTGGNIDYATETHKLSVKFLGEDWIISEMTPPTTSLTNENTIVSGGTVKLAKESISGILNQGDFLTVDDVKFQLDDLEAHGGVTNAIISILDANDNLLKKDKVAPATTKEIVVPGGKSYRFHVYKVAPGYTFGAKWAEVAVYSKELKLQNGQKLDPDYDSNKYWTTYLGWKNKGASATDTEPDHLRTIILYSNNMNKLSSGGSSDLVVGDYIPIVMDPVKWKLSYNGLDLKSDKYDSLSFDLEKSSAYTISTTYGPLNSSGNRANCTIAAPYIRAQSGKSGATFTLAGASGATTSGTTDVSDDEFYIATNGATCAGGIGSLAAGSAFMQVSSSSEFWAYKAYVANMSVQYPEIGDGDMTWALGGLIQWANWTDADGASGTTSIAASGLFNNSGATGTVPEWVFGISEKAGVGTSNSYTDQMYFALDVSGSTSDFNIDTYDSGSAQMFKKDNIRYAYAGPVSTGTTFGEEGFITERGSVYDETSTSSVDFSMANDLAHAQWFLASVSANATPGTTQLTLKEGESGTVSGVTIKAKSIDQKAVCTGGAGGSPACTPNMSGVSAVIMPNNAAEVQAAMPYEFSKYTPLVMLDKDAVGVSTVVSVGGDAVNTVTASILSGSSVDWTAEPKMVKEVVKGSKIVVAGATASDTMDAAEDFISQLQ